MTGITDVIVASWRVQDDWASVMLDDMRDGFAALGIEARRIRLDSDDGGASVGAVRTLWRELAEAGRVPLLVDGMAATPFDDLTRFSLVLDHPLTHTKLGATGSRTLLGLCDERHMAITGYSASPTIFFPHAGPPPEPQPRPMAERDVGVLFAGNLGFPPGGARWKAALGGLPPILRPAFEQALDDVIETGRDSYEAFAAAAAATDLPDLARETLSTTIIGLEVLSQSWHRHRVLTALADLPEPFPLHVVGKVEDGYFPDPGSIVFHDVLSFRDIQDLMRRARVVSNITPKFAAGSHERIAHSMALGAVVLTNPSRYIARDFTEGESVLFLGDPGEDRRRLAELLAVPADLQSISDRAAAPYRENHTWERRIRRDLLPELDRRGRI